MNALQTKLSDKFLLEELSKFLEKENIIHYRGDKMIIFETHTFGRHVHRIEIDDETSDFVLSITMANKSEQKIEFQHARNLVHQIKTMLN